MTNLVRHEEAHWVSRTGWLRAAMLGANDGIVSTASLVLGIAASGATNDTILVAAIAGLTSGAVAMAAGEYISVSSQLDTERADLKRESEELRLNPISEREELVALYMSHGLDRNLATRVVEQMTAKNPLEAHARDELGISSAMSARPIQAAAASASAFGVGALLPVSVVLLTPGGFLVPAIVASALLSLAGLGAMGAQVGGAPLIKSVIRVVFWGVTALAVTTGVGALFGAVA